MPSFSPTVASSLLRSCSMNLGAPARAAMLDRCSPGFLKRNPLPPACRLDGEVYEPALASRSASDWTTYAPLAAQHASRASRRVGRPAGTSRLGIPASPVLPDDLQRLCARFDPAHQRSVTQGHPELLTPTLVATLKVRLRRVHLHAEVAKQAISQRQRLADQYN
jgi:hypothetical protein